MHSFLSQRNFLVFTTGQSKYMYCVGHIAMLSGKIGCTEMI